MIRNLKIGGFKSISSMELELGSLNVLIGANGAGKSNILEAVGVLGAAAQGKIDDTNLMARGVRAGLPRVYKTSFKDISTPVHIALEAQGGSGQIYRVSLLNPLENPAPAWNYKTEYLFDGSLDIVSEGVRSKKNLEPSSGLSALQILGEKKDSPALPFIRQLQSYSIYCPNTPTLRGMQPDPQTRSPVGLSGGRLAEALEEFRSVKGAARREAIDAIMGLVDWAQDVDVASDVSALLSPSVPRTKSVIRFSDRYMQKSRNSLTAYDASEGALYVLFTALLALSEKAPDFLAVDNIDQALNPRLATALVSLLSGWLLSKTSNPQWIVTTHNPAVLDGLDLADDRIRLFAVERTSEGHTGLRRITLDEKTIGLLDRYPLSRLWLMGNLGAVPNV
jgi:energy-coupling factor transporter ATP-binding protein EcfA2